MHIACPQCGTVNRVPDERPSGEPVCGRCGAEIMAAKPASLSDATFERYIARTEQPIVVDFWAGWCGPCKMMAPNFDAAAAELPELRFAKIDIDANPRATAASGVRSVPTLILYRGGKELARQAGAMSASALKQWLRQALGLR